MFHSVQKTRLANNFLELTFCAPLSFLRSLMVMAEIMWEKDLQSGYILR